MRRALFNLAASCAAVAVVVTPAAALWLYVDGQLQALR